MVAYFGFGFCVIMLFVYFSESKANRTRIALAQGEQKQWSMVVVNAVNDGKQLLHFLGALHFAQVIWS